MKIIIIDDQKSWRMLLRHLFCSMSKDVVVLDFERPDDALEAIKQETPDLIVLDYVMPNMNGIELAKQLRSVSQRYVPIIMISVMDDLDLRQDAFDSGCIDVLPKPINMKELQSRCKNIMSMVGTNNERI